MVECPETEDDFRDWCNENPNGYVVNFHINPETPDSGEGIPYYGVLHVGSCHLLRRLGLQYVTGDYRKACGTNVAELEAWLNENRGHGLSKRCRSCNRSDHREPGGYLGNVGLGREREREMPFEHIFHTDNRAQDKFASRLFGTFSEEIVRIWCGDEQAPYADLGRPTLRTPEHERGHTIDFTFENRESGLVYVAEMKCELEYQNYHNLTLTGPEQLHRHLQKPAFQSFVHLATDPEAMPVVVNQQERGIDGAILVWGRYSDDGYQSVMDAYGFADILSVENIVADLLNWNNAQYAEFIAERQAWCAHVLEGLESPEVFGI